MLAFWTFCLFLELSLFAPRLFCVFPVFVPVTPCSVILCLLRMLYLSGCCVSLGGCFLSWLCPFVVFFEGVFASPPSVRFSLGLF